jgi:P-type E1-E2 ATPase
MKLFLRFVAAGLLTAGAMFGPSVWPDLPAAYLRWGPAVLALTWLAYVAVNSLLKQGARAFIDEALVASAAALVFAAGLQSQNDALAVATPALVAITWLGRWLEGLNRRHLIRQTRAALDERDAPPVQDDQLWGDRRQVDDADPAWTNAPREDTLGLPPSTEPKDLLPQIVAPHGRRASQLARAAGRAASWLPLAALPTAILLALALLWWHTPPARALLLAASVLLAIVPRGLRRSWVGPLLLATGRAAKDGVRFPDGAAMEAAGKAHWVVFDGQGTMTDHDRQVAGVVAIDELSEEEVLALAAGMEQVDGQTSLGRAIVQEAQSRTLTPVQVRLVRRHAGQGLSATTPKGEVLLGTRQMLLQQGISVAHADEVAVDLEAQAHSVVFLALAGRIQGVIAVANRPRPDAEGISKDLTALQVEPVLMTDDSQLAAEALGRQLGFDHVRAEIPPEQWAEQVQFLRETGHGVAMVTRLPRHEQALAAADVGLTLHNDDDSADTTTVHLAGDAPSQAVHAVAWARAAWRTARQLVFVAIVLLLAQMGLPFIFSGTAQTWHIPLAVALLSALTPALVCWPLLAAPRHPLSSRDES